MSAVSDGLHDDALRGMRKRGDTLPTMAELLGSSVTTVHRRLKAIGLVDSRAAAEPTLATVPWNLADAERTIARGGTYAQLADRYGCTEHQARHRVRYGLDHEAAATALRDRTCLSCREVFASNGPGNRMCQRCRYQTDYLPDAVARGVRVGG